jgi:hypothetical protein
VQQRHLTTMFQNKGSHFRGSAAHASAVLRSAHQYGCFSFVTRYVVVVVYCWQRFVVHPR